MLSMNSLPYIGRSEELFQSDISNFEKKISHEISSSRFLIVGAAGTIGQSITKELLKREPLSIHLVDISENNMVELIRDIRSSIGYSKGELKNFILDIGSTEFENFIKNEGPYDYIFNLSALKHVRSEKDPYTLMRLITVNIINSLKILELIKENGVKKYFCVSTDKASNPVNFMGASKRIMEMFLMHKSQIIPTSMARFANVAFSDGSLLHGFNQRFDKFQPLSAPKDIRRYFISKKESGELCLLSGLLGENRDIFFPKLSKILNLISFPEIAIKFLNSKGFEHFECETEAEARSRANDLIKKKKWPCYFFKSDTTGEKDFEEFYTNNENLVLDRFRAIGIIKNNSYNDTNSINLFIENIQFLKDKGNWSKIDLLNLFIKILPNFNHNEFGKFLDDKM